MSSPANLGTAQLATVAAVGLGVLGVAYMASGRKSTSEKSSKPVSSTPSIQQVVQAAIDPKAASDLATQQLLAEQEAEAAELAKKKVTKMKKKKPTTMPSRSTIIQDLPSKKQQAQMEMAPTPIVPIDSGMEIDDDEGWQTGKSLELWKPSNRFGVSSH